MTFSLLPGTPLFLKLGEPYSCLEDTTCVIPGFVRVVVASTQEKKKFGIYPNPSVTGRMWDKVNFLNHSTEVLREKKIHAFLKGNANSLSWCRVFIYRPPPKCRRRNKGQVLNGSSSCVRMHAGKARPVLSLFDQLLSTGLCVLGSPAL